MSTPTRCSSDLNSNSMSNITTSDAVASAPRNSESSDVAPVSSLTERLGNKLSIKQNHSVLNIINSRNIHLGDTININLSSDASAVSESKEIIVKTEAIEAVMSARCEPTHKYMNIISKQLGENWKCVFRKLKIEEGEIELTYEENFPKGIVEVIYQLLLKWIRSDDRTLGELCTVLWDEEKHSLVQKLATMYESSK